MDSLLEGYLRQTFQDCYEALTLEMYVYLP